MCKISCDSCGRSIRQDKFKDKATGMEYCKSCCTRSGQLKPYEEIKNELVKFYMEFYDYPKSAAEKFVISKLKSMPAWEKREYY